jgi:hypothetical protein
VIQWFAGACLPWTEEKRTNFIKAVLQLVWDEEFNDEDRETMLTEREAMPESMASVTRYHFFKRKDGSLVTRWTSAEENKIVYMCGDERCSAADVLLFERKGKKTEDPLSLLEITRDNTGQLYGFITNEKGMYVYKSHRPGKSGTGEKCDNVSTIKIHRAKVVELGDVLEETVNENYQLTEPILDKSVRRVVNAKRMCMLLDLTLRYMDNMGVQGKRWFYRSIEARKVGHIGKA